MIKFILPAIAVIGALSTLHVPQAETEVAPLLALKINKIPSAARTEPDPLLGIVIEDPLHDAEKLIVQQSKQLKCMARNIYYEARGEGYKGMLSVGTIVMERLDVNYRKAKTVCQVVYANKQFSWTHMDLPEPKGKGWKTSLKVAKQVLDGKRVKALKGVLHYHAKSVNPYWASSYPLAIPVGNHIYRTVATNP